MSDVYYHHRDNAKISIIIIAMPLPIPIYILYSLYWYPVSQNQRYVYIYIFVYLNGGDGYEDYHIRIHFLHSYTNMKKDIV